MRAAAKVDENGKGLAVELAGRKLQATATVSFWLVYTALCLLFLAYAQHVGRRQHATSIVAPLVPPFLLAVDLLLMLYAGLRRAGVLLATRSEPGVIAAALAAQSAAVVLAVVLVWAAFDGPIRPMLTGFGPLTARGLLSCVGLWAIAGLCALSPWWDAPNTLVRDEPKPEPEPEPQTEPDAPLPLEGTIICCSGGGIRSAAFSLGALQQLQKIGILARARALIGVSGGGYIAGALVTINQPGDGDGIDSEGAGDDSQGAGERPPPAPFAAGSTEVALLRTQTNYLAPDGPIWYDLALSWTLGAATNLVLVYCALQVAAALIAWQALVAGTVQIMPASLTPAHWDFHAVGWQSALWWEVPLGSLVLFVFSRWAQATPHRFPGRIWFAATKSILAPLQVFWSRARLSLVVLGVFGWLLVVAVPRLSVVLHEAALRNQPTPYLAWLLHRLGFADLTDCLSMLQFTGHAACGASAHPGRPTALVPTVSLLVAASTLLALTRSALKEWKSLETGGGGGPSGLLNRLLAKFRHRAAPTLALALLVLLVLAVITRWTAEYLHHPAEIDDWTAWRLPAGPRNPAIPLLILCIARFGGATATSLFPFYRDRLARAFLMVRDAAGNPHLRDRADWPLMSRLTAVVHPSAGQENQEDQESQEGQAAVQRHAPLSGQASVPELVLCATANIQNPGLLPVGRDGALFIFSGSRIGLSEPHLPGREGTRLLPAAVYESVAPHTVADAVAISGSALSPIAGRNSRTVAPFRILMALANVRTGAWVPNPCWIATEKPVRLPGILGHYQSWVGTANNLLNRANVYSVVAEATGAPSLYRPWLYLTDGGQYDNLGLVEALRRRPKRVIVLDASVSRYTPFASTGAAIATARMDGIAEIKGFDPELLKPDGAGYSQRGWAQASAEYTAEKGGGTAEIVFIKSVLTRGQSWDVQAYKATHDEFPLTPTTNQLYDEFDFEAYRQLGWALVEQCDPLQPVKKDDAVENDDGSDPSAEPDPPR